MTTPHIAMTDQETTPRNIHIRAITQLSVDRRCIHPQWLGPRVTNAWPVHSVKIAS